MTSDAARRAAREALDEAGLTEEALKLPPGVRSFSKVELRVIEWVWEHWLARGTLAFLEGRPGLGKSTLLIDVVARITRGQEMPDGSRGLGRKGRVGFVCTEDPDFVSLARLEAAGADLSRCFLIESLRLDDEDLPMPIELPRDVPRLEQLARTQELDLLIFDAYFSLTPATTDTHSDAKSRSVLTPITRMAAETGCSVVCLRHWNKGKGGALDRGMGSVAHGAAARAVITVAPDPTDEKRSVVAVAKSNLGPIPQSLGFSIVSASERPDGTQLLDAAGKVVSTSRIAWHGAHTATAHDLASEPDEDDGEGATALDEACAFLADALSNGGKSAKAIQAAARDAGITPRTLKRAKAKLKVVSAKQFFSGEWLWQMPDTDEGDQGGQHVDPPHSDGPLRPSWPPSQKTRGPTERVAPFVAPFEKDKNIQMFTDEELTKGANAESPRARAHARSNDSANGADWNER